MDRAACRGGLNWGYVSMMISPETYVDGLRGEPYSQLIEERSRLIACLEELEDFFANPEPRDYVFICPSEDVQYKMTLEYLVALTRLMCERAPEMTGEDYA